MEHERRAAARVFLDRINAGQAADQQTTMSSDEAILLLSMVAWDVQMAASRFEVQRARRRLQRRFDHMRTLGEDTTGRGLSEEEMQDERTALLLSITGRNDWYSVQSFLAEHGWNLPEAVAAWFRDGLPPKKHRHDKTGYGRLTDRMREPYPMPSDAETTPDDSRDLSIWGNVREHYVDDEEDENDEDSDDDEDPHNQIDQENRGKRPHGFVVNANRNPVQRGHDDPSRFAIRYFSKGHDWMNIFKRKVFYFPDLKMPAPNPADYPTDGTLDPRRKIPFDSYNQKHVDELNEWLRENYTRITGFNRRPRSQQWSEEEQERFIELHEAELQRLLQANPGQRRKKLCPFKVNAGLLDSWLKALNDEFHPGDAVKRNGTALLTQRSRMRAIVKRYRVKRDVTFVPVAPIDSSSDEEDDGDEPSDSDSGDDEEDGEQGSAASGASEQSGQDEKGETGDDQGGMGTSSEELPGIGEHDGEEGGTQPGPDEDDPEMYD